MARILIIDHETGVRDLCCDFFRQNGHQVSAVIPGRSILNLLRFENPDLVLLDIHIPGQDGLAVLEAIKTDPEGRKIPVLVFSRAMDPEIRKKALTAGADDILGKEKSFQELKQKVNSLLAASKPVRPSPSPGSCIQLLVVDDEAGIQQFLRLFFERKGYEVLTVGSGEEALECLKKNQPQIILLDVALPGMDGLLTLQKIRATGSSAGVIMITGIQDEASAREATALGAYAYVVKPFDMKYLELTVLTRLALAA